MCGGEAVVYLYSHCHINWLTRSVGFYVADNYTITSYTGCIGTVAGILNSHNTGNNLGDINVAILVLYTLTTVRAYEQVHVLTSSITETMT